MNIWEKIGMTGFVFLMAIMGFGCFSGGKNKYPIHREIVSTIFWVGESSTEENGYIPNSESVWDNRWAEHYGGIDDPQERNGFLPAAFRPKENPFYCALPYNDFENGVRKKEAFELIPWAREKQWDDHESLCKNRWIKIMKNGKTAFAQWEDAGPSGEDDCGYVFGQKPPKNVYLSKAGIDVSPAVASYLSLKDVDKVDWEFVEESDVTRGPWMETITTSGIFWE